MPVKGYPGYTNSIITITTGGVYLGDGINGWAGGTSYVFAVTDREIDLERKRENTTDSGYQEGVGSSPGKNVRFKGFFKGAVPPSTLQNEFVLVAATVSFPFVGVVMVERFKQIGIVGNALQWELSGMTDGTFSG